ncbi:MAG: glutamate synthase, partial [Actinomycetota bacterium]|nr:glutamate synthase [Actinomycetota bacterium]
EGLGDSMYEGTIYIAGHVQSYGADAVEVEMTDNDHRLLADVLGPYDIGLAPERFRKIEAGRRLWNFSTKEPELWRSAL